ncbi:putative member of the p24 [Boothiomyces sp. JEL0838]|nr:putative member of the p24 [Boothiomyces sp. JEL0838]
MIWVLFGLVNSLHFYLSSSETKCFYEELAIHTTVISAYKVLNHEANLDAYLENKLTTLKIVVHSEHTGHNLVDTNGASRGKFHFTTAESGVHKICITPHTQDWFGTHTKIYFDLQLGEETKNSVIELKT